MPIPMPRSSPSRSLRPVAALAWALCGTATAGIAPTPSYPAIAGLAQVRSLDVVADAGSLHLLLAGRFAQRGGEALAYARSRDGGKTWSRPVFVDGKGGAIQSRRGNDARLAVRGQNLVAAWQGRGELPGSGPLEIALSADGGRTWRRGANPATGDGQHNQSYPAPAIDRDGAVHLVWLDDREEHGDSQGLRYARSRDGGRHWLPETTLDPAVCTCCWNRLLALPDGNLAALYRDNEPHDMRLALRRAGTWRDAGAVGAFGWHFAGCPHCGGGLAGVGDRRGIWLHSVVWTGRETTPGLFYLNSGDAGQTWSAPLRLGGADSREGDIAAAATGEAALAYTRPVGGAAAVYALRSRDGGRSWSEPDILTAPGAQADHPRIVAAGAGFRVFWTETRPGGGKVWAMAVLPP